MNYSIKPRLHDTLRPVAALATNRCKNVPCLSVGNNMRTSEQTFTKYIGKMVKKKSKAIPVTDREGP
jgi:hypothetical protein